jgi:hypothetical protein
MAEIPFEYLLAAVEATRGTPEVAPLRYLNATGTITPQREVYRPNESAGVLAEYTRSVPVRTWSDFEASGAADVYTLPMILNCIARGGVPGAGAAAASVVIDPAGANNALEWTAVATGSQGNLISVQYVNPGANNVPFELDLVGNTIIVRLATGPAGAITTIADDISAAVLVHPAISLLVTCLDSGGDDGSGLVTAMPRTFLTGGISAGVSTPAGAVNARLWEFEPTMDADDLEAMTMWWGDPNVEIFRAGFCMPDSLTVSGDAGGTEGVTMSMSGQGLLTERVVAPAAPARLVSPMLMPAMMQLWVDPVNPIGTTPVTGRVVSAEVSVPGAISRKWLAAGPTTGLNFTAIGRGKRHAELTATMELPDGDQLDQWEGYDTLAVRVRFNGPIIDAAPAFYNFVEFDLYGPWAAPSWGEREGTNRTITLSLLSEYDDTVGYDWCVRVQSDRDTL